MSIKSYVKRGIQYITTGIPENHITAEVISLCSSELLIGKNAIITGGTSGIGRAIAIAFIRAGATVVITSRNHEKVIRCTEEMEIETRTRKIYGVELDNTMVGTFSDKVNEIAQILPNHNIDILVNNAGINGGTFKTCSEEEYARVMDTNLKAAFFLSQIVSNYMIENKIRGNILNIASSSSLRPATSAYTLSKWGIRGLTIGLAKTLIKYGIVVNGLAPGPTATPMLIKNGEDDISLANNPSGRYAMPEEIANMALVLTSGMGRMIVGDIVYMTGGAGTITIDDINY